MSSTLDGSGGNWSPWQSTSIARFSSGIGSRRSEQHGSFSSVALCWDWKDQLSRLGLVAPCAHQVVSAVRPFWLCVEG